MRIQQWMCCLASTVFSVLSFPTKEQGNRMYVTRTKQSDLQSLASGYVFEDLPADKLSQLIEGIEEFEDFKGTTTLKPMKTPSPAQDFFLLPLTLEPEAEMLPAHYTGVRPPGVDHMEFKSRDPLGSASNDRNALTGIAPAAQDFPLKSAALAKGVSALYGTAKQSLHNTKAERGGKKIVDVGKSSLNERDKQERKADVAESAARRKAYSERENHAEGYKDTDVRENGENYEVEGHREKGHNAAGFRNIYHKDEYKNDADFYDRGKQGVHFRKHGRVEDKHVQAGEAFGKGGSQDSGFRQAEVSNERKVEKTRNSQNDQHHVGISGLDGFFENIDQFSKDAGAALGEKLAFSKNIDSL